MKKLLTCLAIGLFASAPVASFAQSSSYPDRPIYMVVPLPPGGAADILGRLISQQLSQKYHVNVVVENKPGAGGNIGAEYVARSKPDGYTLLLGTMGIHATYKIYHHLGYDPSKDLAPVVVLADMPNVLVVPKNSPFHTTQEIIETAKKHPGKLTFGSAGFGSSTHMSGELFKYDAHVDIQHVPYKGSAPADTDLVAGRLNMIFENLSGALPFIQAGHMRAIAVTGKQQVPSLPGVPTIAQSGVPSYAFTAWMTVAAPAHTPRAIVDKLNRDITSIMLDPSMKQRLSKLGVTPVPGHHNVEQTNAYIKAQRIEFSKLIEAAHLSAN